MRKKLFAVIAVMACVCVCACATKRFAELKAKYPMENGRYTILDPAAIDGLENDEIDGLYMREVKALMGEPADRRPYYERKTHDRFFVPGTTQVRADDWTFVSNDGSKQIIIKFEDKTVSGFLVEDTK